MTVITYRLAFDLVALTQNYFLPSAYHIKYVASILPKNNLLLSFILVMPAQEAQD